eukprot:9501335-Pyramimonas_sp.AAC.1
MDIYQRLKTYSYPSSANPGIQVAKCQGCGAIDSLTLLILLHPAALLLFRLYSCNSTVSAIHLPTSPRPPPSPPVPFSYCSPTSSHDIMIIVFTLLLPPHHLPRRRRRPLLWLSG